MILVCSDIHGSSRAGNLIKDLDNKYNFDKIIVLGDFLYNGPRNKVPTDYDPNYLIGVFNSLKDKIIAVRGNCDADVDLMVLDFAIPKYKQIEFNEKTFFLTHGDVEELYDFEPNDNEIIMKGHTHLPIMRKNESGGITLNPGSMTFPKGKLNKSYIIIDEDIKMIEFEYKNNDEVEVLNTFNLSETEF